MDVNFKLEVFEGPLDLLFHLIEKNKIDIYDIPIGSVTEQYMEYISEIKNKSMENMSEFLVMAATLLEIKSNMLLPKTSVLEEEDSDPRDDLVNRLIEYKKFKKASEMFNEKQFFGEAYIFKTPDEDIMARIKEKQPIEIFEILDGVTLAVLYDAFREVLKRQDIKRDKIRSGFNSVTRDLFTVEDKIRHISDLLFLKSEFRFEEAFKNDASKSEIVVTFLAVLELIKIKKISIRQESNFDDIFIMAV